LSTAEPRFGTVRPGKSKKRALFAINPKRHPRPTHYLSRPRLARQSLHPAPFRGNHARESAPLFQEPHAL
jgi:hypothetical protein